MRALSYLVALVLATGIVACVTTQGTPEPQGPSELSVPSTMHRLIIANNIPDEFMLCTESRKVDVIEGCTSLGDLRKIHKQRKLVEP